MSEDTTIDPVASALESAREKFPSKRIWAVDSPAGVLVLTVPAKAQYDLYVAYLYADEPVEKAKATQALLLGCALIPDAKTLKGLIDTEYPGLARNQDVIRVCSIAAGITKDTEAKK